MLILSALALAEPMWPVVDAPEGLAPTEERLGPDLLRFAFTDAAGPYWVDVTKGAWGGVCQGSGLVVQLRRDLAADQESFEVESLPPGATAVCAALPKLAEELSLVRRIAKSAPTAATEPPGVPVFPAWHLRLGSVVAAFGLVALLSWARTTFLAASAHVRGFVLAVLVLAAGLRSGSVSVLLGGDAAYERLVSALGLGDLEVKYGETWPSLLGLVYRVFRLVGEPLPLPTDHVHLVNLVASALTPVMAALLARRLGLSRVAAAGVAIGLAVLPQAVTLAGIEDHLVLVSVLQMTAAAAALGAGRLDLFAAGTAAIALGHLRMEQVPVALLAMAPAWRPGWRWFVVLVSTAILTRGAYLSGESGTLPLDPTRLFDTSELPMLIARFGHAGGPISLALGAAGVVGWVLHAHALDGDRAGRLRWAWAAMMAAGTVVPYLPKDLPAADPLRFSLPVMNWAAVFAVAGVAWAWTRRSRRGAWLGAIFAVAVLARLVPDVPPGRLQSRPWVWEQEYRFLREHWASATASVRPPGDPLERVPSRSGPVAWIDGSQDPARAFERWLLLVGGVNVYSWGTGAPRAGDLVYRGTADHLTIRAGGAWPGERCGLHPIAQTEVPPTTDGWSDFGDAPVRLAIFEVQDCAALGADGPVVPAAVQ